ncbi:stalk domain-containing protein [Fenollaria sporofastidiosus]|uniref:stalk domain-containing protein n=1 Tax=Fenollaria sporofastidiosus TaxID=2811778 RepID=UPI001C00122B|nr:stalk domain-containing protein [Fenollaria sporofastidiosus]
MKKKNERHIAILLAVMMIFMNFIITPVMANGEDRIKVTEIEATATNMEPVFGNSVSSEPTFTVTKGTEAHFNTIMGDWKKKNVETGKFEHGDETITAGTWRYEVQIRVDGAYGTTHVLDNNFTVKVNGELWTTEMGLVDTNFSFGHAYSPEFTVEEPAIDLTFYDSYTFDITTVYKNVAISSFSVANNAAGGTRPYTFSKTSGPAWIKVSTDGIISGTPTAMGENEDLVVRVTDSNSNYKEITISVANTVVKPEDRIKVTEIEATATNMEPVFGNSVSSEPTFTVTKGTEAHFNTIMGDWQKKNVETGKFEDGHGTITAGTWRYEAQIRVDGVYGTTHVLDNNFTVKVNGVLWRTKKSVVDTDYSFGNAYSPEFTVEDSTHTDHSARTKTDGQPATCVADGWKDYYKCNGCDKVFDAATNGNEYSDLAAWKTGAGKIDALGHDYSVMQHDDTQHWKKCSRCDSTTTKENHRDGSATCTAKAVCSVCGTQYGDLADHSYSTDWKYDTNNHWKECTCGDKKDSAEHTWNVTAATEETDKHCTICGYVAEPKLGHTHSLTLVPEVKPDCDTDGTKAYYTCSCGKYFEDATATKEITDLEAWKTGAGKIEKLGHDYSVMQHDDTQHWKKCSRCDSTTTKEDHRDGSATCTAKAVCSVCGTQYGDLADHSYSTDWKYDTNNHWKECTCGDKKDSAKHTWNVTAATEETDKHCTICGYVAEPKLGHTHSLTLVPEVEPDCDTDGTKAYYTCSCGKYFEDATATKEITDLEAWKTGAGKIEKLGHDININTPANGTVRLSKTKAKKDDIITVTATANPGYELDKIEVDGTKITGNTFTMPDKNVSVVVTFRVKTVTPPTAHSITVIAYSHGSASASKSSANPGDLISISVYPDHGYVVDEIYVKDAANALISRNDYNFYMPNSAVNVYVHFKPYFYDYDYDYYRPYRPHRHTEDKKEDKKSEDKAIDKDTKKPVEKTESEVVLSIGSKDMNNKYNGIASKKGMDVAPYIKNGRTMLPIRYIAEALGMGVTWDAKTRTVIIQDMFYRVEIPVNTNKIIVNGKTYTSDVKPEIKNNRTMLPIANIARALGLKDGEDIIWDASKRQVIIKRIYDK